MIRNLADLTCRLREIEGSWAWVGQRCTDAFTISGFVPLDSIFCCDFGEDFAEKWFDGALFSAEKELGRREDWGNLHLEMLWNSTAGRRIEAHINAGRTPLNAVCYRSLEVLEADSRIRVMAPPLVLKNRFDDKIFQVGLFRDLGIKGPEALVSRLGEMTYGEVKTRLGSSFVIQLPVGSSGENTYFVHDDDKFQRVLAILGEGALVKIAAYIPCPSLNGNCIVLRKSGRLKAVASCPSVQIVGAAACTNRHETYCGNDFAASQQVPATALEQACEIMERVGLAMGEAGFLGLFGMDFLLDDDDVLALEINPRLQGSTQLLSVMQESRGEIPIAALHVLQFAGLIDEVPDAILDNLARMYRIPYEGAHFIIHSLEPLTCRVHHDVSAGACGLEDGALVRLGDAKTCRDTAATGRWCVLSNLPLPGLAISPEARIAMIQADRRVLADDCFQLNGPAAEFTDALRSRCIMEPCQETEDEQTPGYA